MSAQSLPTTKEHARDHRRIGHRDTGRVTGFLGPNGAGKSATLRIIVGLTGATLRTATISGRSHVDIPPGLTCDYALTACPTSRPWLTSFHATNQSTPAASAVDGRRRFAQGAPRCRPRGDGTRLARRPHETGFPQRARSAEG
ncbi:MAG TPA: ATP-binding cassette domain-containing protein [Streptosporangiaceae bacterium]|nr:ATP-binding cassette domain-containing protein [Streptosporangiaceae bacterium]